MAKLVTYGVAREHLGDDYTTDDNGEMQVVAKHFKAGDERTSEPAVVASLVDSGVLVALESGEKADADHADKAASKLKNKAGAADKAGQ